MSFIKIALIQNNASTIEYKRQELFSMGIKPVLFNILYFPIKCKMITIVTFGI
jgi:hypothetical protein